MNKDISRTIQDIKDLKIQGATSIAKAAVSALGLWTSKNSWEAKELSFWAQKLARSRPTEPLTQNCIFWLLEKAKSKRGKSLLSDSRKIIDSLDKAKEKSVEVGTPLIKNGMTVLTHCHSSTVVAIFKKAYKKGVAFKVLFTETRPKYQGHITASKLVKEGISSTMITDSEAAFIISREDGIEVNLVIVGADAINTDGSALNKVGSYGISLSSKQAKIPFYVTATLLKFTPLPLIIEQRSPSEVWQDRPKNLEIINLAFDRIPAKFITNFITEVGFVKPKDIKKTVQKHYPWIFTRKSFLPSMEIS